MLTPPFPHPQIYFLIRLSLQHRITYSTIQYSKLRRVLAPVPYLVPASCNLSRNLFGKCTMISEKSESWTLLPRVQEGTGPISDSGRYRGNDCEDDDEQERRRPSKAPHCCAPPGSQPVFGGVVLRAGSSFFLVNRDDSGVKVQCTASYDRQRGPRAARLFPFGSAGLHGEGKADSCLPPSSRRISSSHGHCSPPRACTVSYCTSWVVRYRTDIQYNA